MCECLLALRTGLEAHSANIELSAYVMQSTSEQSPVGVREMRQSKSFCRANGVSITENGPTEVTDIDGAPAARRD